VLDTAQTALIQKLHITDKYESTFMGSATCLPCHHLKYISNDKKKFVSINRISEKKLMSKEQSVNSVAGYVIKYNSFLTGISEH
jgi:hypothetical protein